MLLSVVRGINNILALRFDYADGLTCTRGFEIAASDGLFYPADIKIEGPKRLLSSPQVKNPVHVRYGWSGVTDADLRNAQGLPASTFSASAEYFAK